MTTKWKLLLHQIIFSVLHCVSVYLFFFSCFYVKLTCLFDFSLVASSLFWFLWDRLLLINTANWSTAHTLFPKWLWLYCQEINVNLPHWEEHSGNVKLNMIYVTKNFSSMQLVAVVKDGYSDNKWHSPTHCDAEATLAFSLDCITGGTAEEQPKSTFTFHSHASTNSD